MIEIFTIVLNGMPFIQGHISIFQKLQVPWRWHIVEGVSLPLHCTGWCGNMPERFHKNFLSIDGTTEYLDSISSDQVVVYRKTGPWNGKIEMVNAPLGNLALGSVLHEQDVDEFWSAPQLHKIHSLFTTGGAGRAWYYCNYYLGPDIHVVNRVRPGNAEDHAWIRTHKFNGEPWDAHEPPARRFSGRDVKHAETDSLGLVFEHFAYSTSATLDFKEHYYRRPGALSQWTSFVNNQQWPADPGRFLSWVSPGVAICNKTEHFDMVIKNLQEQ